MERDNQQEDISNDGIKVDFDHCSIDCSATREDLRIDLNRRPEVAAHYGITNIDNSPEPSNVSNPPEVLQLREWAIKSNISQTHLSDLLVILNRRLLPELPNTAKTFLQTSQASYDIEEMEDYAANSEPGQFVYFGIAQGLIKCLAAFHKNDIALIINIDGLPISKSGKKHFWPILCKIFYDPDIYEPFAVAIYCGTSKPMHVDDYFADFIGELNILQEEGLVIGDKKFNVRLKAIVADTPARSMCKGTKGHGGYGACERCIVRGHGIKKSSIKNTAKGTKTVCSTKIVYPGVDHPKRSNESFRSRSDPEHHVGLSPLEEILPELNMITIFPLDFMHLVCVGGMKRLLDMLLSGPLKLRLSSRSRRELSRRMTCLTSQTPKEFQRKPQSTNYIARWKATEFKFFLLYCGPIVLRRLLSVKQYKHFLLLHVSMRILCSERLVMRYKDKARKYLEIFVSVLPHLYGEEAQVINMHNLQHIVDDVDTLGCDLSKVNCFPFESYLGRMKVSIRTPNQPLEQYCRRQYEKSLLPNIITEIPSPFTIKSSSIRDGVVIVKSLILNSSFFITISTPNNVVLLKDGSVMEIIKIWGDNKLQESLCIEGNVWKNKTDLYDYPLNSTKVDAWKIPGQISRKAIYNLTSIERKLVKLKLSLKPQGKLVTYVVALLHL